MVSHSDSESGLPREYGRAKLPTYKRLWRNTVIITAMVGLIPLLVLAVVNYYLDQDALRLENEFEMLRILSNTEQSIELVIQEKRAALALVVAEATYAELSDRTRLNAALQNLIGSFGGFIDLAVVRPDGLEAAYAGPYPPRAGEYVDQRWLHQALLQGSFVGSVFMGQRDFPHFVVAFRHQGGPDDIYVLRATLDVELLRQAVASVARDHNTDVFIVDRAGTLQTESAFFGDILTPTGLDIPRQNTTGETIEELRVNGRWVTHGFAGIDRTPFVVAVIKEQPGRMAHWLRTRSELIWFIVISIAVIMAVIYYGSRSTVRRLREADRRRVKVLHNMEYTSKLATIGRMAAGVAHEINNPIAIINENAGLLKDMVTATDAFPQREKTLGLIDTILGSVNRCSGVTRRLLGFARRMDVSLEQIDLETLLTEVVGFQRTEAAHRDIAVNYHFPPGFPSIASDRGQLQQVFLNIIANAFAAVKDGGIIEISGSQVSHGEVIISVTDNGEGISEDDMQSIFEPFFSTKGEFGTGLGLSITYDIVRRLGGEIVVDSVKGAGTRFIVLLPVKYEPPPETDEE
jgi:signal transduction histidine kinase